jgi:hypothetical protein
MSWLFAMQYPHWMMIAERLGGDWISRVCVQSKQES